MLKISKPKPEPELIPPVNVFEALKVRLVDEKSIISQIRAVDEILTKTGLPYCAVGGTLLGCIRHQGFIPWDDDFDILMSESDIKIMMKCKLLESLGFEIGVENSIGSGIFGLFVPETLRVSWRGNDSHIFPYKRIDGNRILTNNGEFENDVSFPFKRLKFEDFSILTPQNARHYLNRTYSDWDKKLEVRTSPHSGNSYSYSGEHSWVLPPEVEFK